MMKIKIQFILSLFMILCTATSGFSFADTIRSRVDTILCFKSGDSVKMKTDINDLTHSFVWVRLRIPSDTLSLTDSLFLQKSDTIVLHATPKDTFPTFYTDTFYISLRQIPEIFLNIPDIQCYNKTPIIINSVSVYDTTYTMENILFFNSLNDTITNIGFLKNENQYEINVNNGDTIGVLMEYRTIGCPKLDTFFSIGTRFSPQLNFQYDQVCFRDSTTIRNLSDFNKDLSDVLIDIEGIQGSFTTPLDFKCLIAENGGIRKVFATIDQQGCVSKDTFFIRNLLEPSALFDFPPACENEFQKILNKSLNTESSYSVSVNVNNTFYSFAEGQEIELPDTLADKLYTFSLVLRNNNGCQDSATYEVNIKPVTYVTFSGLKNDYCEQQEESVLTGSQTGGSFLGLFISNLNASSALFKPLFDTTNLPVQYRFTNSLGCTDTETRIVKNVFPKPVLSLSGLLPAYCEKDAKTMLAINQSNEMASRYMVYRNGNLVLNTVGTKLLFDPLVPGQYRIVNYYIDQNQCFTEIENQTIVNPLPQIELGPSVVIKPGEILTLGNNSSNPPEVSYLWSNGDTGPFVSLSQPGLYILQAENELTTCMKSDTILIKYDENIREELFKIRLFPNPTSEKVFLELGKVFNGIKLFKFDGSPQIINGADQFSTDVFGNLVIDMSNVQPGYYYIKIPEIGEFLVLRI